MKKLPDLDQITAFIAVADELSFKRAAERLALDASALSRRIKDLELRLGFSLLYRTTQTVELTDAGQRFYDGNQEIVAAIRETIASAARISKGRVGHLRVAYMTFASLHILPAAMALYGKAHPDISISVTYQPTQEQKVALTRGEMDIGLMLGPYQHSEFDIRSLTKDRLLVAMPGDHRLASKKRVPAAELRGEAMVLGTDRQWDIYRSRIEDALLANGVELQINCEASNMLGMLGLVKMGLGVTIVPETMRDYCPRGITMLPLAGCDKTIETIAVWRKSARTKVKKFVKTLSAI
jgi:DNA-binding transcriptional LysR family regulator